MQHAADRRRVESTEKGTEGEEWSKEAQKEWTMFLASFQVHDYGKGAGDAPPFVSNETE